MTQISIDDRRKREREQRENDILRSAEKIFFAKGYDSASMDDIAAEAELSKPAVYRYFANKEDLYFAVASRGAEIMCSLMENAVMSKKKGLEKIYSTGTAFYEFFKRYPDHYRLLMHAQSMKIKGYDSPCLKTLAESGMRTLTVMCEAIEEGKKDGSIRKDIDTLMTAIYFSESTMKAVEYNEFKKILEVKGMTQDKYVIHSLELMLNSIKARDQR